MEIEAGPIGAETEAWGTQCGLPGEVELPQGPQAFMGSFPTPKGGLLGCHGDQRMPPADPPCPL